LSVTVRGTDISMTRGDTASIQISIIQNGSAYTPVEGDVVRFALKHTNMTSGNRQFKDQTPLITKVIPNSTMILVLAPEDTANLDFGVYTYDIQITFFDGTVDTFIPNATLYLNPEVD